MTSQGNTSRAKEYERLCIDALDHIGTTYDHHIPFHGGAFLTLAPIASDTYPTSRPNQTTPKTDAKPMSPADFVPVLNQEPSAIATASVQESLGEHQKTRRSSSVGSDTPGKPRFLKLGPVFFGGEPGVTDYAEVDG
jgi:hypothetical protein